MTEMKRTGVVAMLILSLVAGLVSAEEPSTLELAEEPSGLELVESVYNRPDGEDMQSRLTMTRR
jgi:hypothetical protein